VQGAAGHPPRKPAHCMGGSSLGQSLQGPSVLIFGNHTRASAFRKYKFATASHIHPLSPVLPRGKIHVCQPRKMPVASLMLP
jgi:hypothetical protein